MEKKEREKKSPRKEHKVREANEGTNELAVLEVEHDILRSINRSRFRTGWWGVEPR
jgi:hypothetical protein